MRKMLIAFFLVLFFCFFVTNSVCSQFNSTQTQIDSIIKKRWDFRSIRSKYPKSGIEIIALIKKCYPDEIDSMAVIATTKMEKGDWKSAISWFELILTNEPDNLPSFYGIGICKRDLGNKIPSEKFGLWPSSENHFKQVIKIDSAYKDVYYQYSLLESYRKNYAHAIELIDKHLEIDAYNGRAQELRFQLYDKFLHQKSSADAQEWFTSRKSPLDIYNLAESYRLNDQFEMADSIFQILISEHINFPKVQVYLSLVRLYVGTDKPEKAAESYWKAVESVSNAVEENLLCQDFFCITNESEYIFLKQGLPLHSLPQVFQTFWLDRNPMPAAPYNYRLIEHYRRLIYAEKHYRYDRTKHDLFGQMEELLNLQFPPWYYEDYKFDDRGLIFVRHGPPDDKAFAVRSNLPINLSWFYERRDDLPKLIFHFRVAKNAPPGCWQLSTLINNEAVVELMYTWDVKFQRLWESYASPQTVTQADLSALMFRIKDEEKEMVKQAFRHDRHSWPEGTEDLDMVYTTAQFKQNEEKNLVQISYAIPFSKLVEKKSQNDTVFLETGIAIYDDRMILLFKDVKNYYIKDKSDSHVWQNFFIDEFEFPLELKRHNIALHARIPEKNKIGGHKYYITLSDSTRNQLSISTLKLAFNISLKANIEDRHRNQLNIIPNPTKLFNKTEPLFAYFEIYNLSKDLEGKTDYSLNFKLTRIKGKKAVFAKIRGLFGDQKKYQVLIKNDYSGNTQTVSDFMSFDVSRLDKGEYELMLIVKDNISGTETLTKTDFVLN